MKESTFFLTIGDLVIRIDISKITEKTIRDVLSKQITSYYTSELTHDCESPDFTITYIAEEEYRFVKETKGNNGIHYFLETFILKECEALVHYHTSIAQFQFFLKMILQSLLGEQQGFILHSSAICDEKNVHLFLGPNGIGKSTIVENLSSVFTPFADDMVIIRKSNSGWNAYQLPLEKKRYNNLALKGENVRSLCYLKQSENTTLTKLSPIKASNRLLEQLIKNGATEQNVKAVLLFLADVDHFILETPQQTDIPTMQKLVRRYR